MVSERPGVATFLLRALLALSLIYYAWLVLDLMLHPLDVEVYDGASVVGRCLWMLVGASVVVLGSFIIRRVPGNIVGPLLIPWGVSIAGNATREDLGFPLLTSLAHLFLQLFSGVVATPAIMVLILCFPTGQIFRRGVVRLVRPWVILMVITAILEVLSKSPGGPVASGELDFPLNPMFVPALTPYATLINGPLSSGSLTLLGIVGTLSLLILRYRAAPTHERQQIKWFAWMLSSFVAFAFLFSLGLGQIMDTSNSTPFEQSLGATILTLAYGLAVASPAFGISLAILRHRLWEIDLLINRTLVYGSLTALLALLYFGLIVASQALLQGILPRNNDIAIVVSTLAVAALFQPLRHRIQQVIDRRFYRRKYNAARTLAAFTAALRDDVDLAQLSEHLLAIVEDTMQPSHLALWLRPASPERKRTTA